jgi:drug/metabolite transporter (DMT)-like permease
VVGALGIAGLYHGFAHGEASVVAPTSAVVGASVPVVVALALGERPTPVGMIGIVVAVGAVALVSGALGTHQHRTPRSIVLLAVLVGVCFGLLFVALERTASDSGMWPLVIARIASVPMLLLVALAIGARPVRDRASLQIAIVAGVFDMGANVLYLVAVRGGMLSIVAVVASMYPASTVLLAMAVDGERVSRPQAVGLLLAVVALALVTLSR